jgi:uncharacterized membrane protein
MMTPSIDSLAAMRGLRPVLLASLALNLFFLGIGAAIGMRHLITLAPSAGPESIRGPAARIERLATMLPSADAQKLRAQFLARRPAIDAARDAYLRSRDGLDGALRAEPFNIETLRAALARARASRQLLEEALEDVVATAAVEMSTEARGRMMDSPQNSRAPNGPDG